MVCGEWFAKLKIWKLNKHVAYLRNLRGKYFEKN